MMIYEGVGPKVDLFRKSKKDKGKHDLIVDMLKTLATAKGEFTWFDDAQRLVQDFHNTSGETEPKHHKLTSYNARRAIHAVKLSMVMCLDRTHGSDLRIIGEDVERAIAAMMEAEETIK